MESSQPRTLPSRLLEDVNATEDEVADSSDIGVLPTKYDAEQSTYLPALPPNSAVTFRSATVAPSPPGSASLNSDSSASLPALDTFSNSPGTNASETYTTPLSARLRLQTDIVPGCFVTSATDSNVSASHIPISAELQQRPSKIGLLSRTPSIKHTLGTSVGSGSNIGSAPSSVMSSPRLSALADVTPLPSPLLSGDSPGPWRKLASRPTSREYVLPGAADSALVTSTGESISSAIVNQSKRRAYHSLVANADGSPFLKETGNEKSVTRHTRNRSMSEYTPEALQVPRPRQQTVSGSHAMPLEVMNESSSESHMRRERNLAVERGIAPVQTTRLPTPPSSRTGAESSDSDSSVSQLTNFIGRIKKPRHEYFEAYTLDDGKRRRWRALKILGQGTFSKVVLATSQAPNKEDRIDEDDVFGEPMDGIPPQIEAEIDQRKLVAIKICEHGPKGGASEERVEMSLKRELEILKSIHHQSVVHLKAFNIEATRAILVLSYCPGGDLFEVASEHREILTPPLLRRAFAEIVGAVRYLHERRIVHRDIKLENVLVNLPQQELAKPLDWATYPYSVITLTDLGLSRRVADDEMLTTRCGSDDYAAPEVIMGQPYDGRAVDAWSLGVLLYALLEFRLPFDPNPNMSEAHKQRSRTSHRIARVEWAWIQYVGEDGDHEGNIAKFEQLGLIGAMDITEGLLKRARSRWTLERVSQEPWVRDAIQVKGGIKFREEDKAEEVNHTGSAL